MGLGGLALNELLASESQASSAADRGILGGTHIAPKAKRIIYLFMSGGPSHVDTFDYKPKLRKDGGKGAPHQATRLSRRSSSSGVKPAASRSRRLNGPFSTPRQ